MKPVALIENGELIAVSGDNNGDVLTWNGTEWVPNPVITDILATPPITVTNEGGSITIGLNPAELTDIPISAVTGLQDALDSKASVSSVDAAVEDLQGQIDTLDSTKADITYVDIQDASVLAQANTFAEGLAYNVSSKDAAHAATTLALPAYTFSNNVLTATANGPLEAVYTDGHALTLNQRLLVRDEVNQQYNGLYYLSQEGDIDHPWTLTRTNDANTAGELCGANVPVEVGDLYAGSLWIFSANSSTFVINVDPVVWTQLNVTVPDATTSVKGRLRLAGDLDGTAETPTLSVIPGLVAGTYDRATVTVNNKGRVTAIEANPLGEESISYDFYARSVGLSQEGDVLLYNEVLRAFYLSDDPALYVFAAEGAPSGGDVTVGVYNNALLVVEATFADGSANASVSVLGAGNDLLVTVGSTLSVVVTSQPYGISGINFGLGAVAGTNSIINAEYLEQRALKSTQIIAGDGLTGGGDLSADVTLALESLTTASTYGNASSVSVIQTDEYGRVVSASDEAIQIEQSQVTDLALALDAKADASVTLVAGSGLSGGGTLAGPTIEYSLAPLTPNPANIYTNPASIAVDAYGRVILASSGSSGGGSSTVYDQFPQGPGTISLNQIIYRIPVSREFLLSSVAADHKFTAITAPGVGGAVFTVYRGSDVALTVTFAQGSTTASVVVNSANLEFAQGVALTVQCTSGPNGIASVYGNIRANLQDVTPTYDTYKQAIIGDLNLTAPTVVRLDPAVLPASPGWLAGSNYILFEYTGSIVGDFSNLSVDASDIPGVLVGSIINASADSRVIVSLV